MYLDVRRRKKKKQTQKTKWHLVFKMLWVKITHQERVGCMQVTLRRNLEVNWGFSFRFLLYMFKTCSIYLDVADSNVVTDYSVSPFILWAPDSIQKTNGFFFESVTQAECLALNERSGSMNWIEQNWMELSEPGLNTRPAFSMAASFQGLARRWG